MSAASAPGAVLNVNGLVKRFDVRGALGSRATVRAVDNVSFAIGPRETLGLVGESGCGKSTVGRMIVRLIEPTAGSIKLKGVEIAHASEADLRPMRRDVQMVFQDPFGSLNPRMRAGAIVGEPLLVHGIARGAELKDRVEALFHKVGLRSDQMRNTPGQFSGGQRQRLAIARAIAIAPTLIVADEAVSALDVSIQSQVVNLMSDLQADLGLSYLFIAHDLGVVRHLSDRIAVMYLGRIVETGPVDDVFATPAHPYTVSLLRAAPMPDPRRRLVDADIVAGEAPSPISPPKGCHFHPRCSFATDLCRVEPPPPRAIAPAQIVACHHAESVRGRIHSATLKQSR